MKKLLYILLFCVLPFVVSAQLGLNNNTVTISSTGTIQADSVINTVVVLQPNEIDFTYAHSNQSFKDSAVTITGGTNNQYIWFWRLYYNEFQCLLRTILRTMKYAEVF